MFCDRLLVLARLSSRRGDCPFVLNIVFSKWRLLSRPAAWPIVLEIASCSSWRLSPLPEVYLHVVSIVFSSWRMPSCHGDSPRPGYFLSF